VLESPAYPGLLRGLAALFVAGLLGFGLWSLPALATAAWSASGLALFALGALCIGAMGYWIVKSRTRLDGDELTQTWLWRKRVNAAEVAQLKLVHWRGLEALIAPRLLVRRRSGAVGWFHAANAQLLVEFGHRVALRLTPSLTDGREGESAAPEPKASDFNA
jgi:hypothetical protein